MDSAAPTTIDSTQPQPPSQQTPPRFRTRNAFEMISTGGLGHEADHELPNITSKDVEDALGAHEQEFFPNEPRSLSGIALRACLLGMTFTGSIVLTLYTIFYTSSPVWRAPLFMALVSLFHFLEFWTTARYNTGQASVSSFLLSSNGAPYTLAIIGAFFECLVTCLLFPNRALLSQTANNIILSLGLTLTILGQIIRSAAIITAGTSFNHIVQHTKKKKHKLIDFGIFAYLRHPSYFGYFWWGLGTQAMLGNRICFMLYATMLWKFFDSRITGEERGLVRFFGDDYVKYRARTPVGIPFIP